MYEFNDCYVLPRGVNSLGVGAMCMLERRHFLSTLENTLLYVYTDF